MTHTFTAAAVAIAFMIPATSALADAHEDAEACNSMLATSVGMALDEEGIDTANACALSVADLAQIKGLLDTDGMGSRAQIEQILADAGQ